MVATGIRDAYADLFNINIAANTLSQSEVEGKFKTLTNGSKAASTITQMAKTFCALCAYADWSAEESQAEKHMDNTPDLSNSDDEDDTNTAHGKTVAATGFDLSYDIHIHLPATRDQAVYDALFASLAKHLPLK